MRHVHEKSSKAYEIGRLMDTDGKSFDINVITKWDEENDFEQSPIIIDYYFGDYDKNDTDFYIDEFVKKQGTLKQVVKYLEEQLLIDHEFMKPEEVEKLQNTIKTVKEMITDLV